MSCRKKLRAGSLAGTGSTAYRPSTQTGPEVRPRATVAAGQGVVNVPLERRRHASRLQPGTARKLLPTRAKESGSVRVQLDPVGMAFDRLPVAGQIEARVRGLVRIFASGF